MEEQAKEKVRELWDTLQIEKRYDQETYIEFLKNTSLTERRNRGLSWFPLDVVETGYGLGDYPYVVVKRTKSLGVSHQFTGGKLVRLFLEDKDEKEEIRGVVHWAERDQLKVVLMQDDLPHWLNKGSLGLDLDFDEKTYQEMQRALGKLLEVEKGRLFQLGEMAYGNRKLREAEDHSYLTIPSLNQSQNLAVRNIVGNQDFCVVHGPPGTGKTTTLVEAIKILAKSEKTVLVCTPSNAAADHITRKLADKGLNVTRLGNIGRMDESVLKHTMEIKIGGHDRAKEIKTIRRKANELRSMARKYKRSFGKEEREQRKLLFREAKEMSKDVIELENYIADDILDKSDVLTCTLVGSTTNFIKERFFKTVIIDEAAQALEAACWIPILKAEKVVLAGDPFQLPPTVKSNEAAKKGLSITLMERLIGKVPNVSLLDTQYRMNELIMGYSNTWFYKNQLKAHKSVAEHKLEIDRNVALEFIDTAGCSFEENQNPQSLSLYNDEEINIILKHLESITGEIKDEVSVGVISPYKEQVVRMQDRFPVDGAKFSVNTIDSFQGQERDLIYISLVRSNDRGEIGFLSDYRRMNVAMTRARKKLVVIGDSGTLSVDQFFAGFFDFCEKKGSYFSAWEFMY